MRLLEAPRPAEIIEMKSLSMPSESIFEVIFLNNSCDAFLDLVFESRKPTISSGKNVWMNSPMSSTFEAAADALFVSSSNLFNFQIYAIAASRMGRAELWVACFVLRMFTTSGKKV